MVEVAPAVEAGAAAAVMPVGMPETAKATSPVNPPERVRLTVEVPSSPWARLRALGARLIPNSGTGAATTVRFRVAVAADTPEPVARTVMVWDPGVAVGPAERVTSLVVDPDEMDVGLAVAVTPAGVPSTEMETDPVYPPPRVTVTVVAAEEAFWGPVDEEDPPTCWSRLMELVEREMEIVGLSLFPPPVGEPSPPQPREKAETTRTRDTAHLIGATRTGTSAEITLL